MAFMFIQKLLVYNIFFLQMIACYLVLLQVRNVNRFGLCYRLMRWLWIRKLIWQRVMLCLARMFLRPYKLLLLNPWVLVL